MSCLGNCGSCLLRKASLQSLFNVNILKFFLCPSCFVRILDLLGRLLVASGGLGRLGVFWYCWEACWAFEAPNF